MTKRKPPVESKDLRDLFSAPPAPVPAAAAAEGDLPLRVVELARRISQSVSKGFPDSLSVIGEVSNFTDRGHWYFSLKDAESVIPCIIWRGEEAHRGPMPRSGDQVVVRGKLDYWIPGGRISLRCDRITAAGAGALEARLLALTAELRGLGWLDPSKKRPLPLYPQRIAIITSRTGAALQDCLATARKRFPAIRIVVVDTRVQGAGVEHEIANAIRSVSNAHEALNLDAIVLTRGGGSIEDLWCFNERVVAEAIHECRIPIVTAIGHETDTTLADLVGDYRAPTPTAAITAVVPDRTALAEELDATAKRARIGLERMVSVLKERLHHQTAQLNSAALARIALTARVLLALQGRWGAVHPRAILREGQLHWAAARDALRRAMIDAISSRKHAISEQSARLKAINPLAVLKRGYAVISTTDGQVLSSVAHARVGQELTAQLRDGSISVRTLSMTETPNEQG
ncbi:MAG: exodeoxyribonuclease VII large subunit [Planctomycetota bacterium]|nr:exodeoxyribonuclease VII large subunit [Planctomycetota bacterium]